jgi:uncharacterized protein YacL
MDKLIALSIDGYGKIGAPEGVPTGGLFGTGDKIIQNGITILLIVAVIFALVMFIWGAIMWITSQGDKAKVQAARNRLIFAIVGLIVAFLSFFVIALFSNLFGIQFIGTSPSSRCSGRICQTQQ